MSFTPPGYKPPVTSGKYLKLETGRTRFRVLAPMIVGWKGWTLGDEPRPIRVPKEEALPIEQVDPEQVRHFWAFPVYNYGTKRVQVLEITQSTIREAILELVENPEWGEPMDYDLTITRTGEKLETKYAVVPSPKAALSDEAVAAWEKAKPTFDLTRLFDNGDPFGEEKKENAGSPLASDAKKATIRGLLAQKAIHDASQIHGYLQQTFGIKPGTMTEADADMVIRALTEAQPAPAGEAKTDDIPF